MVEGQPRPQGLSLFRAEVAKHLLASASATATNINTPMVYHGLVLIENSTVFVGGQTEGWLAVIHQP